MSAAAAAAAGEAQPMETDGEASSQPSQPLSLPLLQVIRLAQAQNGLEHGDYGRYRSYCTKRLQTLYKSLKMTHGKKQYQKKKLETKHIVDPRHLHIPLISAERAWAYAMDIKNEMGNTVHRRKRKHLIKRLSKAALWASELAAFSAEKCDARSALEAAAYSSWMQGNVLFEKETDWSGAMGLYLEAKRLFQELAKVGDLAQQGHCVQRVEEIDASLRFCDYEIRRQGGAVPDPKELLALGQKGAGTGMLQAKLAALAEEAQVQQAASTSELEWRGRRVPVRHERVRVCLHQAGELAAQLAPAQAGSSEERGIETQLATYDRMINCYNEARGFVRNAVKGGGAAATGGETEELQGLESAISGVILDRTVERSTAAVQHAEGRFLTSLERIAQGKKLKDKDKFAKPDDVVRLYDILIRNTEDLNELAGRLGGRQGEQLITSCTVKISEYKALRCFYLAHMHLASAAYREAHGLFLRAVDRAAEASALLDDLPRPEPATLQALSTAAARAKTYAVVARAELSAAFEREKAAVAGQVGGISLGEEKAGEEKVEEAAKYLLDDLEVWESRAEGGAGGLPRLFQYPQQPEAIATRPIMFDTAVSHLVYPELEHRKPKVEKPGVLKSWLGWGRG